MTFLFVHLKEFQSAAIGKKIKNELKPKMYNIIVTSEVLFVNDLYSKKVINLSQKIKSCALISILIILNDHCF